MATTSSSVKRTNVGPAACCLFALEGMTTAAFMAELHSGRRLVDRSWGNRLAESRSSAGRYLIYILPSFCGRSAVSVASSVNCCNLLSRHTFVVVVQRTLVLLGGLKLDDLQGSRI
jgi:hypothetical protein